jgi:hypothetical protein
LQHCLRCEQLLQQAIHSPHTPRHHQLQHLRRQRRRTALRSASLQHHQTKDVLFWNEEWRKILNSAGTNTQNTIDPADIPKAGENLTYMPPGFASGAFLVVPNISAASAALDLIEAGTRQVAGLKVVVFDVAVQQGKARDVRGVLGEDFLAQFDLLIDNAHSMVCLDNSGTMRQEMKGRHMELLTSTAGTRTGLTNPPVVAVRLSDGKRPVLLELDSGADMCLLFNSSSMEWGVLQIVPVPGSGASAQQRAFRTVPSQDMKVGSVEIAKVPFITFSGASKVSHPSDYDGLLSLGLFKRVLISHAANFAVLER